MQKRVGSCLKNNKINLIYSCHRTSTSHLRSHFSKDDGNSYILAKITNPKHNILGSGNDSANRFRKSSCVLLAPFPVCWSQTFCLGLDVCQQTSQCIFHLAVPLAALATAEFICIGSSPELSYSGGSSTATPDGCSSVMVSLLPGDDDIPAIRPTSICLAAWWVEGLPLFVSEVEFTSSHARRVCIRASSRGHCGAISLHPTPAAWYLSVFPASLTLAL